MKHIVIGIVYCIAATPIALSFSPLDYILPAQVCPPPKWPFDKEAREKYKPFDNWNETTNYFR